jgi:hypothetical protein
LPAIRDSALLTAFYAYRLRRRLGPDVGVRRQTPNSPSAKSSNERASPTPPPPNNSPYSAKAACSHHAATTRPSATAPTSCAVAWASRRSPRGREGADVARVERDRLGPELRRVVLHHHLNGTPVHPDRQDSSVSGVQHLESGPVRCPPGRPGWPIGRGAIPGDQLEAQGGVGEDDAIHVDRLPVAGELLGHLLDRSRSRSTSRMEPSTPAWEVRSVDLSDSFLKSRPTGHTAARPRRPGRAPVIARGRRLAVEDLRVHLGRLARAPHDEPASRDAFRDTGGRGQRPGRRRMSQRSGSGTSTRCPRPAVPGVV